MLVKSRIEKKHVISSRLLHDFEESCLELEPDGIDEYFVNSVYLSSRELENDMLHNTQRVDKYRIRYYPEIREGFDTRIFAEIKSKDGALRFKRTIPISEVEVMSVLQGDYGKFNRMDRRDSRLEIISAYRRIMPYPLLTVSYNRKIYMFGDTRVTLDSNISAKLYGKLKTCELFKNEVVVEVKYSGAIDIKVLGLQNRLSRDEGVSKYRHARMILLGLGY